MLSIPNPSRQPYAPPDEYRGLDPITRALPFYAGIGPSYERRIEMQHGRNLAGLGGMNFQETGYDPRFNSDLVADLEREDDVYGSGIFDAAGSKPTVHPELGVFQDHPSIPGYIGREEQFAISTEVADVANGAGVVVVPAGGMSYREVNGRPAGFIQRGPIPQPPPFYMPPPTDLVHPYVSLTQPGMSGCCPPGLGDVQVPMQPNWQPMGSRDISRVAQTADALGQEETSLTTWALVGLGVGVAAAVAVKVLTKKKARPNRRRR